MTAYGRSLSKELLSTWSQVGEERWAYAITTPEWLNLGGDERFIQLYTNTPTFTQWQSFFMQNNVEASVNYKGFYADGAAGVQGGPEGTPNRGHFVSQHYYVGYKPTDETSVRAGRFYPAYGLNVPNHSIDTRKNLGFDEGQETDNLEASYSGEKADLFVTGIFGRVDDYVADWRRGAAVSGSYFLFDRFKIGLSLMYTKAAGVATELASLWGILGFTKKIYMLSEFDMQWQNQPGSADTSGCVTYQQLNYEFIQGLHVYLVGQLSYLNFNNNQPDDESWGVGTQLFPRPHIDVELEYRKEKTPTYSSYYDAGWAMLHFYL